MESRREEKEERKKEQRNGQSKNMTLFSVLYLRFFIRSIEIVLNVKVPLCDVTLL